MPAIFRTTCLFIALLLGAGCQSTPAPDVEANASLSLDATFGDAFWETWGDGQAEVIGYDFTVPRYGHLRSGTAVTIFVTETFSNDLRVKADPGKHPASDEVPVMKLNLVEDFPTGIYDYNLMTSSFVALEPVDGRPGRRSDEGVVFGARMVRTRLRAVGFQRRLGAPNAAQLF